MSDKTMTTQEKVIGTILWGIILFTAFWYWNCSDGVRAVKNMHVDEIFHQEVLHGMNDRTAALTMSQPMLESVGYNIELTFEEAIARTNPKSVVFEPGSFNLLPEFRDKTVKPVSVTVTYDPPLDDKYTSINMVIGVQKDWFFHFNPVPVSPAISSVYKNGNVNVILLPAYNNFQVAEPVLKYFRDHK